jgi:hypothetical protein
MLYDPKWNETKTEEPSFAGFIAWLEKHPTDDEYVWGDNNDCACAQYAKSLGRFDEWRSRSWNRNGRIWFFLDGAALNFSCTFGEALKCARNALTLMGS